MHRNDNNNQTSAVKRHLCRAQQIQPAAGSIACSSAEHGNLATIIVATKTIVVHG